MIYEILLLIAGFLAGYFSAGLLLRAADAGVETISPEPPKAETKESAPHCLENDL